MRVFLRYLTALIIPVMCSVCKPSDNKSTDDWYFDKSEITGIEKATNDRLAVDIYLDVTASMEGFCLPQPTNFSRFLEDIEATCNNVWARTDIKYYKYGSRVDSINREQFVSAGRDRSIFTGGAINNRTELANTIRNSDPDRVSILVTDLFYRDNDINSVVNSIRNHCIERGIEIGFAGIESDFRGWVGDLGPGVPRVNVNGARPLYAVVFGNKATINLLFRALSQRPYLRGNEFLLIANKPTENFDVQLEKNRRSRTINNMKTPKRLETYGTVFSFSMDEEEREGLLSMHLTLHPVRNTVSYDAGRLKTLIYKKAIGAKDSVVADDEIRFSNLKLSDNQLTGDIQLTNKDGKGKYIYGIYFSPEPTTPVLPDWIRQRSADTYGQGNNETKTLNLARLIGTVLTGHMTIAKPKIAKFYIYLEKK